MATGRPVVCLDLGGTALQVTDETGIKVSVVSADQVVRDLAEGLSQLARDASFRARLGEAARKRVTEHFNWEKKGQDVARMYNQLLNENAKLTKSRPSNFPAGTPVRSGTE
jgi:glycosyltransferase involved in cell wall biosynthesis